MHDNTEYVLESVRAGAHGYLLKDTAATELRGAIRAVHGGESYFSPPIASRLTAVVRGQQASETPAGLLAQLTRASARYWRGWPGADQQGDRRGARNQPPDRGDPPGEPDAEAPHPNRRGPDPLCPGAG